VAFAALGRCHRRRPVARALPLPGLRPHRAAGGNASQLSAHPEQPPGTRDMASEERRWFSRDRQAMASGSGRVRGPDAAGRAAQRRQRRFVARLHPSLLRRSCRPGRPEHPVAHRAGGRISVAGQCTVERRGLDTDTGRQRGMGRTVRARAGGRAGQVGGVMVAAGTRGLFVRDGPGLCDAGAGVLLSGARCVCSTGYGGRPGRVGLVLAPPSRRGLWVLTGMALMVAGTMLPLMHNLGWLPATFVTQYGVQIGAVLEIPLVLIGLYFRSRERRDNRFRLEALSKTDPLTGVGNHRVLMDRLQHLLVRSYRDSILGTVLRVHVANLEVIRAGHGREAAEAAMVRAAECVAREAAATDTVAREEGGDLVLILEGQVTHGHAVYAARNIVANGLQFSDRLPEGVSLTLQVGGARAPLPQTDAAGLLGMLHQVIVELHRDPQRRALRFIDRSSFSPTALPSAQPASIDS